MQTMSKGNLNLNETSKLLPSVQVQSSLKEAEEIADAYLEQAKAEDPGFYNKYIKDQWAPLIVNAVRDFVWAYYSYEQYKKRFDDGDSFEEKSLLQVAVATAFGANQK